MIKSAVFATIFSFTSLGFAEETQLRTLEPSKIKTATPSVSNKKIESTIKLNTLQVTTPNLNFVPTEGASSDTGAQIQKPNPIPKWEQIKKIELPIFPIYSESGKTYISLLNNKTGLSKVIEDQLRVIWKKENTGNFSVEGPLVAQIFKELNVPADGVFFIRIFESGKIEKININEVRKLQIRTNGAGDGIFGTVAMDAPLKSKVSSSYLVPVGLAWRSNNNPFFEEKISEVKLHSSNLSIRTQKELEETVEYLQPSDKQAKFELAQETEIDCGDWKFVEVFMPFEQTEGYKQNLLGYFIKKDGHTIQVKDFYADGTYSSRAEKIFSGRLFREYKQTIIFPSTGMGDCGKILLLDNSGSWTETEIHCGIWGC